MEALVKFAVDRKAVTWFAALLILVGGVAAYFQLGKLEDPDFTVKTAIIHTAYPGASPAEVEEEVTDRIEGAIQEMPQLRYLTSYSRAGSSLIKVEIKQEYWADRLPQVWDEMRKKIRDVSGQLPPGAGKPSVMDDFSFVYGFVLAVTGDGYSYSELEEHVKGIRKELNLVPGVSRVELWGQQPKVIYIDVSETQLAQLGLTTEVLLANLTAQNVVVDAGGIEIRDQRYRFEVTGDFTSVEAIENLPVRASILDASIRALGSLADRAPRAERSTSLIRVKDVATVRRGYLEPPITKMRFANGPLEPGRQPPPCIGVSIANVTGGNILDTGRALDERLRQLEAELPVGIEVERIAWQSDLVDESISAFMINLLEAVLIVLVVIAIAMGLRMGIIIGTALVLTILGTFMIMAAMGIDLQRVSLGALVIALGMMVDNAIVVADNTAVAIKRGMDRRKAAIQAAGKPSIALLGATFVAVMAFYPIYSAKADAGEYASSLFTVVGISLLLSWLISMTVTPLQCVAMLPEPKPDESKGTDEYGSPFFRGYRWLLEGAIRFRLVSLLGIVALMLLSMKGFEKVDRVFFTDATRTQFMIDYWAPEGTRIQQVSEDLRSIEDKLLEDRDRVLNVSTFIGSGPPRFYLPVDPEFPYQSYAQLIVNTTDLASVSPLVEEMQAWVNETQPQALVRVRKFTAGPGFTWPLEARFSGPADADREVLKSLAAQGVEILRSTSSAKDIRTDMRQPTPRVVADYNEDRARWSVVSRVNVGSALRAAYDGLPVGLYREGDDLQPVLVRFTEQERGRLSDSLETLQVRPSLATRSVPLDSVVNDIGMEWEDPILVRWNRRPAITVQAGPADGVTFPALFEEVREKFEAIELPPGYKLEWRGEQFGTVDSQASLVPGVIPSLAVMVFIVVALFNAFRPPLCIFLVVPLAGIGITAGLLGFGQPFSFMALLGAMSLVGMMIKNAIVLLDEIGANRDSGIAPYDAVVTAGLSRVRPVLLGAITTVLGVAPLIQDIFWVAMAVTIMAGLTFGTILTMVIVPVIYCALHRIPSPSK